MVRSSIRQTFANIADNDYAIPPGLDPAEFLISSLPLLGEIDGEFRERYVYGTLHRWVVSNEVPLDGLRAFHKALLADRALFAGIGDIETDSIFMRAFSVLMLVPTIYAHRQRAYLTLGDIAETAAALARYLRDERDLRGYVSIEKWWGHGIAHAADAVRQLVQCSELDTDQIADLLSAIATAMTPSTNVYAHEEDARMAAAVIQLLSQEGTDPSLIEAWLKDVTPSTRFNGTLPGVHIRYVNARNFLRCLIFQAQVQELPAPWGALFSAAHQALPDR